MKRLFIFISISIVIACEKFNPPEEDCRIISTSSLVETPHTVLSNEVLERAYKMAKMVWTPVKPVPMLGGRVYEPDITVTGAPYSQAGPFNTSLFQDVSYHTFMTAVHNPKSVLYTENLSRDPYNGLNCATYYGSVCSSAVMWALGFATPYSTYHIIELPYMKKLENQNLDSLKVCDVLWKSGHVQMVFEVERRLDTLYRIKLFEQSGKSAHIKEYSKSSLKQMWDKNGYVAYRYEYLRYSDEPISYNGFDEVVYNDDLCPSKGDRAVYRTDDTVCINIFNQNYDEIVLKKDGKVLSVDKLNGDLYMYQCLLPGIYDSFLQNGNSASSPISFEIIEADVALSLNADTKEIVVYLETSAKADYIALYRLDMQPIFYPIPDQDCDSKRQIIVPAWDMQDYYCRVVFRGKYGRIINRPIKVNWF